MANKLELTWYGKDEPIRVEPRLLIENTALSNTAADLDTENMLIHGDNLLALKALESKYAGQVKCIYIDPPYNIDAMNEYYEDLIEHSMWLNRMRPRIEILRNLLCEEGIIFIQISDEEQAYLKVLCDEVFGRRNFVNMISVNMKNVAGASGGGEDKKLKKNCEFILVYDRGMSWFPHHQGGANKPVLERRSALFHPAGAQHGPENPDERRQERKKYLTISLHVTNAASFVSNHNGGCKGGSFRHEKACITSRGASESWSTENPERRSFREKVRDDFAWGNFGMFVWRGFGRAGFCHPGH